MTSPLLDVENINAGYGDINVLYSVAIQVGKGQFVALLGRNGMGKSTLIRAVMGQVRPTGGRIQFGGRDTTDEPVYRIAQLGVGLVPEGRAVFPNLTVLENLLSGAANRQKQAEPWTVQSVYRLFPRLEERKNNLGSKLSGGEQQMLAIGRALMTNPRLLILDEATEGLAPLIRREIWKCLLELKSRGLSMLVVDKNLGPLSLLADQLYVLKNGNVVWRGNKQAFAAERHLVDKHLTVAATSYEAHSGTKDSKANTSPAL
jgi:branched-chain amino acid transport system ATP-binding protein